MNSSHLPHLEIPPGKDWTVLIDSLRSSKSNDYSEKMRETVNKVLLLEDENALEQTLLNIFPENKHKVLREFFLQHPVCWIDLLRKLHKYKIKDLADDWIIEEEHIEEIYKTFLVRWRTNNIWSQLRKILPQAITENQSLLEFASKQPSLLDSGWYSYAKLPKTERYKTSIALITLWLTQNIKECTYENRDVHYKEIFPQILNYLNAIFWIKPNVSFCQNIEQLAKALEKMFDSGKWEERENALRVIQAFHAWSSLWEIKEMHNNACKMVDEVPQILKQRLWTPVHSITQKDEDWAIIYSWKIMITDQEYSIQWRVKSVKSILQKMWITEEYTNIDAIRDMLGISIITPDDTPTEQKVFTMTKFMTLMPDYWYLLKNKWFFDKDSLRQLQVNGELKRKVPIYATTKRWDSTNDNLNNASLSGYMRIWELDLWTEIQISTKSCMEWKKWDDKWYKPKDAILGLIRWPKFWTPWQFYKLLNKKIDVDTLNKLGVSSINDIIIRLIDEKFIIPYVSVDGQVILLTCKWKIREYIFQKKFPTMIECTNSNHHYQKLLHYLKNIKPLTV